MIRLTAIVVLLTIGAPLDARAFGLACAKHDIEHRLTKFNHPWTNAFVSSGQNSLKDSDSTRSTTQRD